MVSKILKFSVPIVALWYLVATTKVSHSPFLQAYHNHNRVSHDVSSEQEDLVIVSPSSSSSSNNGNGTSSSSSSSSSLRQTNRAITGSRFPTDNPQVFSKIEETTQRAVCDLTVVLMDPRLPIAGPDQPIWGAIESVLAHTIGDICVLLQTSVCVLDNDNDNDNNNNDNDKDDVKEPDDMMRIWQAMTEKAPHPYLQSALQAGPNQWVPGPKGGGRFRVRITLVDPQRYSLTSCHNFWTPTNAWINANYWGHDEFTDDDADMILMIQDDTLLCRDLDPQKWKRFAFVGAPWPQDIHSVLSLFLPLAMAMDRWWDSWTKAKGSSTTGMMKSSHPPFDTSARDYYGPAGNGGLSLRSRAWMQRVIQMCPHVSLSGLTPSELQSTVCRVGERNMVMDAIDATLQRLFGNRVRIYELPLLGSMAAEDLYFAIVLRGLGAPVPTAFEASLFSSEMMYPDQIAELYGPMDPAIQRQMVSDLMTPQTIEVERFDQYLENGGHFIPIGTHQIWKKDKDFAGSYLNGKDSKGGSICPYFESVHQGW